MNLLERDTLKDVMQKIREEIGASEAPMKEKTGQIRSLLEAAAAEAGLELKLRK